LLSEQAKTIIVITLEVIMHQDRLTRLVESMQAEKFGAIALNPSPNLYYLTGLSFHLLERPIVGLFTPDQKPLLILPELERPKAEACDLDLELISYAESEASRNQAFSDAAARLDLNTRCIGADVLGLRMLELRLLETAAPGASFVSGDSVLLQLRMIKDEAEVEAMRRAVAVAQTALEATLPFIRPGVSERELAAELVLQLLRAGSEPELPFSPIVASGPNSALPHATPGERMIEAGDLLLLDWGATVEGYVSDLTRNFAIGEVEAELAQIHQIVERANAAGREAIRPGVTCAEIDQACRAVIEAAGYGEHFIHRTGHGIGLDAHETPYISIGNNQVLTPGMTFTIEPGIYLLGRGGVRVEDDVLVTADGGQSLSTYPRGMENILET
jgi:Xaa-Pro dipeptidase